MLISSKISDFIVFEREPVMRALEKINSNKSKIVFVVNDGGGLVGAFSDGDFRRWLTESSEFNLNSEVGAIANTNTIACSISESKINIERLFKPGVEIIPLLDDYKRIASIAFKGREGISIGGRSISSNSPAYIIAEIGNNHNGDVELAKNLVNLAYDAGADCVKFQMRDMSSLYKGGGGKDKSADLGAQYTLDLLSKFQLSNDELIETFEHCKSLGLTPLCTPWDINSLNVLEEYGMEAYKVASADFTNHELLGAMAKTGKPLFCSTGMCTESEIKESVGFLKKNGANFVLLHCNSTYPTPFKDVNLSYVNRLKDIAGSIVGYSGHERGVSVPVAAVALGAKVIEKHFTIDKTMEGNDHKVSLLPDEFKTMVRMIREVEESMGSGGERSISQGELINRETLAKSLVASRSIKFGEIISPEMVEVKSPGQGLQPMYINQLIGRKANREISSGDYFYSSDLEENIIKPKNYNFNRPFGIPVRYHDYSKLSSKTNLDFVEFHLSYQDMDLNPSEFFSGVQNIGFAIHSPELFSGDHIMDLSSPCEEYRKRSIFELNRVCQITRDLKKFFPITERPVIVINAGGFSTSSFIKKEDRQILYSRVASSLSEVDSSGVEIIIQTMPPFPWHFGGQSFHNIFVDPIEIKNFSIKHGYRICYDISHSMMACNYYKWDLSEFTKLIGPYIAHMHVVDALGVDGEGIQIGKGDVNFTQLSKDLEIYSPGAQFIPEVWQGHKNQGEGFWFALEFLEFYFKK